MDRFPHLDDTNFPDGEAANPYKYKNNFDYASYTTQMEITLCTVPWDVGNVHVGNSIIPGLGNVVYFEGGEAERDSWFDSIPDNEKFTWRTDFRRFHSEGEIRIPVPFDRAAKFNYAYIKYYEVASPDNLVDYESPTFGIKRWFYFVRDMKSIAPNTTELILLRDSWQTFIYKADIPYVRLSRGHYGVANSDAEKYLKDPINNSEWLLAEDNVFGESEQVCDVVDRLLNDSEMYAVIFTTANPHATWGTNEESNPWVTPSFKGADYLQGVASPAAFACSAANFSANMASLYDNIPQFIQTVTGVAFIPRKMLNLSQEIFSFGGSQWYDVTATQQTLPPIKIEDLNFDIPEEYSHLAKLYTSPYSWIEISDGEGGGSVIKIEETTGTIDIKATANLVFPYLNYEFTINGIGGKSKEYTFKNLDTRKFTAGGAWYKHMIDLKIPYFSIFESGEQANKYQEWWTRKSNEKQAKAAYDNAIKSAETAKANTEASALTSQTNEKDSAATSYTNATSSATTSKDNSHRSATTTKTVADRTATTGKAVSNATSATNASNSYNDIATAKTNADADADTGYSNAVNSATAASSTAKNSATTAFNNNNANAEAQSKNADLTISANETNVASSNAGSSQDTNLANMLSIAQQAETAGYNRTTVNNEQDAATASAAVGAIGGTISGAVGGLMSGGIAGAIGGAVSGVVSGATTAINTAIQNNLKTAQSEAYISYSQTTLEDTNTNNTDRTDNGNFWNKAQQDTSNRLIRFTTDVDIETSKTNGKRDRDTAHTNADTTYNAEVTNATNSRNTAKNNAARSYATGNANTAATLTTENTNAQNVYDTNISNNADNYNASIANADDTYGTETANAKRTKEQIEENADRDYSTTTGNAKRSYDTACENAKRTYDAAVYSVEADRLQQKLNSPNIYGNINNADDVTVKPQGLFITACRQTDSHIRQAGDNFLRWGYAANRQVKVESWNVMPRFSFWKCEDVQIRNSSLADAYLDDIRFLLLGGVTIWKNPGDINNYSIYENK